MKQLNTKRNKTLGWLVKVTDKKKGFIIALTIIQGAAGVTGVIYALLFRAVVDSAVGKDMASFKRSVVLIAGLVLISLAINVLIRWLKELAKADIENTFKQRLLDHILKKDYASVSFIHTAEWMNRLVSDTALVADAEVEILPGLTATVIRLVSALIMIIALDPWFSCILIPGGILIIILTFSFRKLLKQLHKDIRESDGRLRIFLQERISSLMVIKAFQAETETSQGAAKAMADHKGARMRRNRVSNIAGTGFAGAMEGMYLMGMVYCAFGIMTGRVSYGTLVAVMQLIGQVQGPFASISGYLPRWYAMTASAERLMGIEEYAEDDKVADRETIRSYYENEFHALGLRQAFFHYKPRKDEDMPLVLKGVDLTIHKGEYVAFTGHSGCGKSTVLKLLMCLYPLDSGEAFIDGQELSAYFRALFAYVPQGSALMNGSIRQVVSFGDSQEAGNDERLNEALTIACAGEFVKDLDAELGERGSGLSEGQMQRISIARAIFARSPILLLDEATSALDQETERQLLENLRSLTDKTVIIVTHRRAALSICDRVLNFTDNGIEEEAG